MKIFFTSILIFIALIKLSAQSFNHDLNWKEFFYNTNPDMAKIYEVRFYPKQLPDDYLVKFTGFTWEEVLADTMENFLKTVKLTDFLPENVVYTTGGVPILLVRMVPFKLEEGKYFYLKNFSIEIFEEVEIKKNLDRKFVDVSVLSSGNWIKMSSKERGIHKLTYARLKELGISDPSSLSVYTNGGFMLPKMNKDEYPDDIVKVPVYHTKDKNGNDAAFFYSPGTVQWDYNQVKKFFNHSINLYSDSAYFFMTSDLSPSNSPEVKKQTTTFADTTITTYLAYNYHEEELNNLINSGRYWLGEVINDKGRRSFTRNFSDVVPSQNATLRIVTAARSFSPSRMFVRINGELIDTLSYTAVSRGEYADYFRYNDKNYSLPANENISIELSYDSQGAGGDSWLDYITWNVPVSLKFSANQLSFRSSEAAKYPVVKFEIQNSLANCQLWDVTDFLNPRSVPFVVNELSKNISVVDSGGVIREYVIFDPVNGNLHEPSFSSKVANQNIHGDKQPYEMIIVTHPSFLAQSEKLADFHRKSDGMSVLVLTTHSIYNEFSSGLPDISGIRNMLRMFYDRQLNTENPLKYLLLMGDGSYDNRNFDGKKNNFIPTYQSVASVSKGNSYVTDDFYGLLDDDEGESEGYLDIGIGRIPCKTAIEAEIVIAKVIDYSSGQSLGNWRNNICFISDDEDNNYYMDDAEKLISLINNNDPGFYFKKIYLDAYPQISTAQGHRYPAVTEAINQAVSDGALILNYIGHANPLALAHENVLGINDIQNWKNNKALPLFITANCEYGRYDDDKNSAGEEILLNPSGGGIALFTTTRAVYAGNNQNLSMNFYTNIFKHDKKGEKLRLGDVMKNSKNLTRDTNKFSFSLLADPALRLAFPKYKIKTTSINGINPEQDTVTMGSLDKITIAGQVVDSDDNTMTGFNGEISTTIYDKEIFLETLANDGGRPFKYSVQSNVIYRGKSSVEKGQFEFSFIVPKDISYSIGQGRVLYYANDGITDGNGSLTSFNIGGSGQNPIIENEPPQLDLFINNEEFKPYDKVSSSILLLAKIYDESGINTAGAGIGHDLVAVLDDDFSSPFILNEFYSSEKNSYQKGTILFPINDLEPGEHKIWVKVWDVQNNSTEKEIYFIVDEEFKVTSVCNFPNPAKDFTKFEISHNLPGEVFNVSIDIYNLTGQKMFQVKELVNSSGKATFTVRWDFFQPDILVNPNQWLVYRVELVNQSGGKAYGAGKMLMKR